MGDYIIDRFDFIKDGFASGFIAPDAGGKDVFLHVSALASIGLPGPAISVTGPVDAAGTGVQVRQDLDLYEERA